MKTKKSRGCLYYPIVIAIIIGSLLWSCTEDNDPAPKETPKPVTTDGPPGDPPNPDGK